MHQLHPLVLLENFGLKKKDLSAGELNQSEVGHPKNSGYSRTLYTVPIALQERSK